MKEYNINELISSDTVVNCKTKKQAKSFLEYLHNQRYVWEDGGLLLGETYYERYGKHTSYEVTDYKTVCYSEKKWFRDNGYKIINLEDIEIKKPKKDFIRTLHFKNPCLTQQEYELVKDILSECISDKDFDKTTWQGDNEYYFISKDIKIPIQIDTLQKLCQNFPSVSLTDKNIYIKNLGGKI